MVTLFARRSAVLAVVTVASILVFSSSAAALPTLDTSFGGGVVTPKVYPTGKWAQIARGAVLQPDGKLLVPMALSPRYGRRAERPVLRYNPDGRLDPTYGTNGAAWIGIPGEKSFGLTDIALLPNGKSIVTGSTGYRRVAERRFVARLTVSGRLDKSFGNKGATKFADRWRGNSRELRGVYLLASGKVLIAFQQSRLNEDTLDLMRLDENGRVDRDFGKKGIKSIKLAPNRLFPLISDIEIVGDEALVLVVPEPRDNSVPCKLIRTKVTAKGGLVRSFGKDGVASIASAVKNKRHFCLDVTSTADGGVAVAGSIFFGDDMGTSAGFVQKLRANGLRDRAFGTEGIVQGRVNDDFDAIMETSTGEFFVSGHRTRPDQVDIGPTGGTAAVVGAQGGLIELLAGATIPETTRGYATRLDQNATGIVTLYSRYSQKHGEIDSRLVKFTN